MKQSRLASFLESCGNTLSGFFISLVCQFGFLVWWKGLPMTWHDNLEFATFMTFVSVARSFGWRRLMEALHVRIPLSPAMQAVIAERQRQVEIEGWDIKHDDEHCPGELARAGAAYLMSGAGMQYVGVKFWPWADNWWKPDVVRPRRDFVRGLALGLAELEKHDRTKRKRAA